MTLERLWAGWRSTYIEGVANQAPATAGAECLFCALAAGDPAEMMVLAHNDHAFAVMNAYPYTSGHLMVAPLRHESTLAGLSRDAVYGVEEPTKSLGRVAYRDENHRPCRCPRRSARTPQMSRPPQVPLGKNRRSVGH